jgi:hypothetical protein
VGALIDLLKTFWKPIAIRIMNSLWKAGYRATDISLYQAEQKFLRDAIELSAIKRTERGR